MFILAGLIVSDFNLAIWLQFPRIWGPSFPILQTRQHMVTADNSCVTILLVLLPVSPWDVAVALCVLQFVTIPFCIFDPR